MEFVWIILGSLALVGYTEKSKHVVLDNNIPLYKSAEQFYWSIVEESSLKAREYACMKWEVSVETSPEGIKRYESRDIACKWYTNKERLISTTKDRYDTASNWSYSNAPNEIASYWKDETLDLYFDKYTKAADELRSALEEEKDNLFNQALAYVFPYIFGFAIAIRFSKAIGDLRNAKSKLAKEMRDKSKLKLRRKIIYKIRDR
ncbi:hypothetical protein MKK64_11860 [Methylobacterium sp. E-025]|uniref:hypothetical protein n=1 Tax=Methylobacterium sp. E-025 TaxID=2836561 RepID=UPI001FB93BE7|nr:hypothetical protein [Methylobacterium sp. E-025]MCJ2111892.1 hypothetical protein [Methylobacterium sp. E-025]